MEHLRVDITKNYLFTIPSFVRRGCDQAVFHHAESECGDFDTIATEITTVTPHGRYRVELLEEFPSVLPVCNANVVSRSNRTLSHSQSQEHCKSAFSAWKSGKSGKYLHELSNGLWTEEAKVSIGERHALVAVLNMAGEARVPTGWAYHAHRVLARARNSGGCAGPTGW